MLEASEIPDNPRGEVLVVTNDSRYRIGDTIVNPHNFVLERYDAVAFTLVATEFSDSTTEPETTTLGGSALFASFILVASAFLIPQLSFSNDR